MVAIANFGTFSIDSADLISINGSIQYPYIKFSRLRNFTTLQLAAKTRENISLTLAFTDNVESKLNALEIMGALRSSRTLNVGSKNWGKYQIASISREITNLAKRQEIRIELEQTEQVIPQADFSAQTNVIGNYGLFDIKRDELIEPTNWSLAYPTLELERFQNFPKVQNAGDDLKEIKLNLRFNKAYNQSPITRLDTLRVLADFYVFFNLSILGTDYGNYVVKSLDWEYKKLDDIGNGRVIDVTANLLQSPTNLPPKLPVITFFYINGVDQALSLQGAVNSITYEDPIDSNSLLEIEFDATVQGIPQEGDIVRVVWKYSGEDNTFDTGTLKCDRPFRRYSPDTITIGAQSLNWSTAIDSQQPIRFTATNLNAILTNFASTYGLTLTTNAPTTVIPGTTTTTTGTIVFEANSAFDAITQLARDYAFSAKVRFDKLSFQSLSSLEDNGTIFGLTPTDCLSAEFTQKTRGTYSQAIFPYKGTNTAATVVDANSPTGAVLDFRTGSQFWNDSAAAIARSRGELKYYNNQRHTGTIKIEGRFDAVSGNNIQLASFDNSNDNGKFMITKATHVLSASQGWQTSLEIRKIYA